MIKTLRLLAIVMSCVLILALCGCNKTEEPTIVDITTTAAPTTIDPYITNPLTGVKNLKREMENKRPVAVMINNIKVAQDVQTGLNNADMVFETLVEGGITRLMAVYSDISSVSQIGTIRSARYSYAELACGLDARYIHCGSDNKYCTPLMNELELDHIDLNADDGSMSKRISNGHDYEHTLYTYGDKIYKTYKKGRTDIKQRAVGVYSFNAENSPVTYDDSAIKVKVRFSDFYVTTFEYDKKANKYVRIVDGEKLTDYVSGEKEKFTNVFVLNTDVYALSDGQHMRSQLDEGSGTYISNGSCVKIKWKKGDSTDALKFFDLEGNELKINAGNSYICINDRAPDITKAAKNNN